MTKRKIVVVITARPSYSRIKTVLTNLLSYKACELEIVVCASALIRNYGDASETIVNDGFRISKSLLTSLDGSTHLAAAKTTGLNVIELSQFFNDSKPNIVVTIADRFETISTAIAASYQNIPLAHIQGGELSGNIDEKVRHSITKLSDIHFPSTALAAKNIIQMGEDPNFVYNTGCPSIDLAKVALSSPITLDNEYLKSIGVGYDIDINSDYFVVLQHPITSETGSAIHQVQQTLQAIEHFNKPTFWFWPNIDAGNNVISKELRNYRERHKNSKIKFIKNLAPELFLQLLRKGKCLIGNSSVGIRESSYMAIPVVNIGSRQVNRERASNVIDCAHDSKAIINSIRVQLDRTDISQSSLYGDGNSGSKIAEILMNVTPSITKKFNKI